MQPLRKLWQQPDILGVMADNSYVPLGLYQNYLLAHLRLNDAM